MNVYQCVSMISYFSYLDLLLQLLLDVTLTSCYNVSYGYTLMNLYLMFIVG